MASYKVELDAISLAWNFFCTVPWVCEQWRLWRCCAQANAHLSVSYSNNVYSYGNLQTRNMNMILYISLSIAKPFQSNLPKALLNNNWLQLYDWKNVDIVVFFWRWSSKGVAYANFISDLLSVVYASFCRIYELIRLYEMECPMWVALGQYRPL